MIILNEFIFKNQDEERMAINPFDPKASSPEKIAEQFGSIIKAELYEVGYAYIGVRKSNCAENRESMQKRFLIYDWKNSYEIRLWYGSSVNINCNEFSEHHAQGIQLSEIDFKDTHFGISIAQLNKNLEITFNVVDNLGILNLTNRLYYRNLNNLGDLLTELQMLRIVILQQLKR